MCVSWTIQWLSLRRANISLRSRCFSRDTRSSWRQRHVINKWQHAAFVDCVRYSGYLIVSYCCFKYQAVVSCTLEVSVLLINYLYLLVSFFLSRHSRSYYNVRSYKYWEMFKVRKSMSYFGEDGTQLVEISMKVLSGTRSGVQEILPSSKMIIRSYMLSPGIHFDYVLTWPWKNNLVSRSWHIISSWKVIVCNIIQAQDGRTE